MLGYQTGLEAGTSHHVCPMLQVRRSLFPFQINDIKRAVVVDCYLPTFGSHNGPVSSGPLRSNQERLFWCDRHREGSTESKDFLCSDPESRGRRRLKWPKNKQIVRSAARCERSSEGICEKQVFYTYVRNRSNVSDFKTHETSFES